MSSASAGANIELGASFLPTSKYRRIWRRSLIIRFFISLKKPTSANGSYESPPILSSVPYTSLLPPPSRTSSAKSFVAIDIGSHAQEEEEKEDTEEQCIAGIVEEQEHGGVDCVCDVLSGQRQHSELEKNGDLGMLDTPVAVAVSVAVHGTRSFSGFLWNTCKHNRYTISMLLISAALSFATEFMEEGPKYGWHDGVAIVFAVLLLLAFSSVTSFWREREMRKLAKRSSMSCCYNPEKRGLLEGLIEKPISCVDKASLFVFPLVALVVFIRLICKKDGDSGGFPEIKGNVSVGLLMRVLERVLLRPPGRISILTGLFTAVIMCVQHGVPLVVTISLNYQIDEVVSDQDAVLNDSSACTTMGMVTVICIDVSGELISKPMEVSRIWMGETDISNKVEESEADPVVLDMLKQGVGLSVLAPELSLSPMSNSLVAWAETTWKNDIKSFSEKTVILKHRKLDSDHKEGSGVLVREVGVSDSEQVLHLHWNGAACTILEMCSHYYDSKGECHAMENDQKIKFGQVIKEMEDSDLKPIAFAYKQTKVQEELEQDELTLLALIGLKYKSQESTKLALENLRNTGIQIKLVSEDDIMSVKDIACKLGIIEVPVDVDGHGIVMLEGKELQDLNDKARLEKVDQAIVMGSFSPEDKLLMVQCLQDQGDHVVAFVAERLMTNHISQVLKVADVGIVQNSLSRIMDRESCGISITHFSALKPIVRAGRSKYHNIQKFIQLQLTVSISGLLITLITTISTGKSPLTAIQLIWVNMLMCILGGLMMSMELSREEELAKQPSERRNKPIITKGIWKNIVIQVLYQVVACMVLEFGGHVTESEREVRKTMIFNTFLLCQLFNLLKTMDLLKREVFKVVVQSYCFWVALGGCLVMHVMVIEYAKGLADCMSLNATEWGICVLVGALSWVLEWALNNNKVLPVILSTNWFHLSWGSPFMMLLLFPVGLIGMTFRLVALAK